MGETLLVGQDVTESRLPGFHVDDGLVGVGHRPRLDPWHDMLVCRQLEELLDLLRAADHRTDEASSLRDESPHRHGERFLWDSHLYVGAIKAEEVHVIHQGHLQWLVSHGSVATRQGKSKHMARNRDNPVCGRRRGSTYLW